MPENADVDLETYNPLDPAVQQNPFPSYATLRRKAPVFRHPLTGIYFVSRHSTVKRVLGDTDTFSSRMANAVSASRTNFSPEITEELQKLRSMTSPPSNTMLTADPPVQTRYRKAMGRDFNQRIPTFEPAIRKIAQDLTEPWPQSGRVDFMNGFAVPFPVRTIAAALTMKAGLESDIKRWSDDSVAALGVSIDGERLLESARGVLELQRYWIDRVETCRENPGDDFLSDLVRAPFEEPDGTKRLLNTEECISILQQLMVAGNETTTKLLNEIMKLLAQNPDQWQRLRDEPARVEAVVEEGLRIASPNQGLFRQVRSDTELEGVEIPKGSTMWVMFGSANRDAEIFPDPDRFDPDRTNLREHLAFGYAAHFCIGAPLARLETKIALEEILARVASFRIADDCKLTYEPSFILRGLAELDLEIERI